jgi:phosphate transport system substrate-binding protein
LKNCQAVFPGGFKREGIMGPLRVAGCLLAWCLLFIPAPALAQSGSGPRLVIPGTGDSMLLLRDLAEQFMRANPGVTVDVPDPIGSTGARRSVLDGKATLGRVANSSSAKEQGSGLSYLDFALTPVVFAVHPSVAGVEDITPEQALGIYSGRITDWSELGGQPGKIYPLARETGDSSWNRIREILPGFRDIESPAGKAYYTTPEALRALERHPGTIGFGPLAMYASGQARILTLSGRKPLEPNGGKAGYPLFITLGLIWKGELGALERRFVEFMLSPGGAGVIRRHSCLPFGGKP